MITDEGDSGAFDETPAVFERGDIGAEMIDKYILRDNFIFIPCSRYQPTSS